MPYQLIAEGDAEQLLQLGELEDQYREGDKGYLDIELLYAPPQSVIDALDQSLRISQITGYSMDSYSNGVRIYFQKAIPPLAIIAAAIAVAIAIVAIVIAWKLYKFSPESFFKWSILAVVAIVAVVVAIVVVVTAIRRHI